MLLKLLSFAMDLKYRAKNNILRFEKLKLRRLCDFGSVFLSEIAGPLHSPKLPHHGLAGTGSFSRAEQGQQKPARADEALGFDCALGAKSSAIAPPRICNQVSNAGSREDWPTSGVLPLCSCFALKPKDGQKKKTQQSQHE